MSQPPPFPPSDSPPVSSPVPASPLPTPVPPPSAPVSPAPAPPAAGNAAPASGKSACLLAGCGCLLLLGVLGAIVGGFYWFTQSKDGKSGIPFFQSDSDASSSQGGNGLGLGAVLSQFHHAGGSACVIGSDGAWHAVFQENPTHGQPVFIYHTVSRDGGRSWSAPQSISDDGTGNGAGFPRMGRDTQGQVYAAWVRFGQMGQPVASVTLDGPGGYQSGTLMLRRWSGSQWDAAQTVGTHEKIATFCLMNAADGALHIVWVDEGGMIAHAPVAGGAGNVIVPPGGIPCDNPAYNRPKNLSAVPSANGGITLIAERPFENQQQLVLWQNGQLRVIDADPKYQTRNTFNYPAQMFADRAGRLHVIHIPHPLAVGKQVLRDLDPATGQHTVIFSGRDGGNEIANFQVLAERGVAHVTVQWSAGSAITAGTTDVAAVSFDGTRWAEPRGLTGNSRGESFFHKDMPGGDVGMIQRYYARHASMALDSAGKVHALTTIDARSSFSTGSIENIGGRNYNVVSGGSVSEPSLYVLPWQ